MTGDDVSWIIVGLGVVLLMICIFIIMNSGHSYEEDAPSYEGSFNTEIINLTDTSYTITTNNMNVVLYPGTKMYTSLSTGDVFIAESSQPIRTFRRHLLTPVSTLYLFNDGIIDEIEWARFDNYWKYPVNFTSPTSNFRLKPNYHVYYPIHIGEKWSVNDYSKKLGEVNIPINTRHVIYDGKKVITKQRLFISV